ncbi:MAG TPA: ABC transporter permease [Oscillatoriaceae cyanobacterium]
MNLLEEILTVWRALLANKLRSLLTLLGVIMGVGTIVLLSSLIAGGLSAIHRTVDAASGADVINVGVDYWNARGHFVPRLDAADIRALSESPPLSGALVVPQLDTQMDAQAGIHTAHVRVVGTNQRALSFYQLELAKGRFLTEGDRLDGRHVCVLGQQAAQQLFPQSGGFGELRLGDERFDVVGVLSRKPSLNVGNQTWNNAIVIPDKTYMAWQGKSDVDTILVKTNRLADLKASLPQSVDAIRAILINRHHDAATLRVTDSLAQDGSEQGFLAALRILMVAVAVLCLGVGGINIMNIMLVSVTERTREIGLRLAIGARKRDIRRQFLFEAAAISALGGLLGVAGGIALGWTISAGLALWLGNWPYVLEPVAVVAAFSSALVTGLVFGWYPAHQAANLQPIECLRYE